MKLELNPKKGIRGMLKTPSIKLSRISETAIKNYKKLHENE
jgi:hypothetical protein